MLVDRLPPVMGGIKDKSEGEDVNNKEERTCDPVQFAEAIPGKIWRKNVNKKKDAENAEA